MTEPWAPYRPPVRAPRGWKVGPLEAVFDLAAGDGACFDAALRVDQSVAMDLAVGDGACFAGTVDISTIANSYTDMLLADGGGGDGLPADVSVDSVTAMNLADGSGGTALAPALSVVNPAVFEDNGANTTAGITSGTTMSTSWTHPAGSNGNRLILVWMNINAGGFTYGTPVVTCGGVAMTQLGERTLGPTTSETFILYGLTGQSAAAKTIALSCSRNTSAGTTHLSGVSASYYAASSFGSVLSNSGGAGSATLTQAVTAQAGAIKFVHAFCGVQNISGYAGPGVTQRTLQNFLWDIAQGDGPAGNYSITAAQSSARWASIGVRLL
jgi:hypothetical protein